MPKKIERAIQRQYQKKGKSAKEAKTIAYKIMNKKGLMKRGR